MFTLIIKNAIVNIDAQSLVQIIDKDKLLLVDRNGNKREYQLDSDSSITETNLSKGVKATILLS